MQKRAPQGMVAQQFTILAASVATLMPGDLVKISASMEVDFADAAGDIPIGQVAAVDRPNGKCTVELFADRIIEQKASAALAAGSLVKVGAAKGKVVVANPAGVAADIPLVIGITLNEAAADNDVVYVVPRKA